jgi:5'-3' exonuclease
MGTPYNLLIDGSHLLHRIAWTSQGELTDSRGNPSGLVHGFYTSLLNVARQYKNQATAFVVFDAGVSEFRKKLNPSYKMERKEKQPDKPLPDIRAASLFIHAINQIAGIPSFMDVAIEGDDFITALLKFLVPEGGYSVIVSSDKDFYQLLSDKKKILMYDPIKKEYFTEKSVIEMGFDPDCWRDQYILFRAITGDKDEVPKIMKGLGPTRALPIAKTLCYGCRSSSKYADVVFESLDQIETNISLFDLDVAFHAIRDQICSILRGYTPCPRTGIDRVRGVVLALSKWELKEVSSRASDIASLARKSPIKC